jgi:exodeoxyribonuclease VII small subunit
MTAAVEKRDEMTFEETIEKIRVIVGDLEGGQLSLEDSIERYREGSKLIEHTRRLIADAEVRISELSAPASEG